MTSLDQGPNSKNESSLFIVLYTAFSAVLSLVIAYFTPVFICQLNDILDLAIEVFAIFSGFSLTLLGIIGSLDSVLSSFSWKQLQNYKSTFEAQIIRQAMICTLYSVVLCLAFVLTALDSYNPIYLWVSRVFVFLSCFSLLASVSIPFTLYDLHRQRYEYMMKEKGAP